MTHNKDRTIISIVWGLGPPGRCRTCIINSTLCTLPDQYPNLKGLGPSGSPASCIAEDPRTLRAMALRGSGFATEPGLGAELEEHVFKAVSQLMVHSNISLRVLRQIVQQRVGVDLADRKAEIRSFAKRSLEVLTCRTECDRGRMLFTQLPDDVDSTARWRGAWEPLVDKGWWHDGRTRNTCCIRTGTSWELFCLERGFQLEGESLSEKVSGAGDDNFKAVFSEADVDGVLLSERPNSKLRPAEQLFGGMGATSCFVHGPKSIDKQIVDSCLNRTSQFVGNYTGFQERGMAVAVNQVIGRDAPQRKVLAAPLQSKEALGRSAICGDAWDPGGDTVSWTIRTTD